MTRKQQLIGIAAAAAILIVLSIVFFLVKGSSSAWWAVRGSVLPQLVQSTHKERVPIVFRRFSPAIDIAYVIDHPETYDFIMRKQLEDWGIDEATLHAYALENLEELAADTPVEVARATAGKDEAYAIIETDDGYAAARILSEAIRTKLTYELGDSFVVAMPIRDFLIAWQTDFSLQGNFLTQVQEEYDAAEDYELTPEPFLVTPEGIQPLQRQAPAQP
jgi:uncharacterized protein YtpQ (UPF0354 family)